MWQRIRVTGGSRVASLHQALAPAKFIIVTDLRPVFVVFAPSCRRVVPQAGFLRLLAPEQSGEMKVNFIRQFLGQVGGPEGMRIGIMGTRRVQQHW